MPADSRTGYNWMMGTFPRAPLSLFLAALAMSGGSARAQDEAALESAREQLLRMQQQILQSMGQATKDLNAVTQQIQAGTPPSRSPDTVDFDVPAAETHGVPSMPGVAGRAMMGSPSRDSKASPVADPASDQAAARTTNLLTDPRALGDFVIKSGGAAAAADAVVDRLTSDPRVKHAIHTLSSDVFNELVRRSGGDPERMLEEIKKAERDPAGFARTWSPEAQERLKEISGKVEAPPTDPK